MPGIDVVIPVRNGMPEVRACIEGLQRQTRPLNRIIVIDSGSTDGTDAYLASQPAVELLRIDPTGFNHGLTRNLGWQLSDAEFLFYTVQDARALAPDLLERMADGFRNAGVEGVCGQQVVCQDPRHNPLEWHRPIDPPKDRTFRVPDAASFDALPPAAKREMCAWDNVAAMYRRSALERVPFREVSYGEDMLWAADMLRSGGTLLYRPSARVCHYHLENRGITLRRSLSAQYFRYLHFGYRHPRPKTTLRDIARIFRHTWFERSLPFGLRQGWLRYNLTRRKALREAWDLFDAAVGAGGTALDQLYRDWVETPPVPLKKDPCPAIPSSASS